MAAVTTLVAASPVTSQLVGLPKRDAAKSLGGIMAVVSQWRCVDCWRPRWRPALRGSIKSGLCAWLCHVMHANKHWVETRYAGYFDVAAGWEVPRWVGWTGLDGHASQLRLLLIGFECQQTKCEIRWKKWPTLLSLGMYRISGSGWPDIRPFFAIRFWFWIWPKYCLSPDSATG